MWSRVVQGLAVLLLAILAPACGGKSKGGGGSPKPTGIASVTVTTPSGVQKGVIPISYLLADPGGITSVVSVEYSINGGNVWQPATSGPAGDGTSGLSTTPGGVPHVFSWNSVADGVALGSSDGNIRIRITPSNLAAGSPGATSNFTVDNSGNTAPSVAITPPGGTQSGLVSISYSLTDTQSDLCSLQPSFSVDGGATFSPATPGPGGDGLANLASSPGGGMAHTFLWNSVADGVAPSGVNATVRIRLQPADGAAGAATTTADFSVDNSGKSSGSTLGAGYPIQVNGSSKSDWATSVATDGASLYVLGFEDFDFESSSGADTGWKLRKFQISTGAPVAAFGTAGAVSGNPGPGLDIPFKVVVSGGSLYLAIAREIATRSFQLRIEKRDAVTGALVPAFNGGGFVQTSSPATYDGIPLPWTLAVDGSFLYVAGPQEVSASDSQWRIEKRDKGTGQLISGFGSNGQVDENPTNTVDGCFSIVLGATSMWLVGAENVDGTSMSNGRIRIEKRKLLNGTLDAGFGTAGVVKVDAGPGDDLGEDAVSDGTSLFVFSRVETELGSGIFQSRIEKRDLATGAAGPVVTGSASDPSGELPFGHLALDGGDLFVCQADGSPDTRWCLERRSASTLSLVTSFGTAGVMQINPSVGGYDRPLGIVAAGGVVLVVGMDSTASDEQWRIEARWR